MGAAWLKDEHGPFGSPLDSVHRAAILHASQRCKFAALAPGDPGKSQGSTRRHLNQKKKKKEVPAI